jgi:hypothetical protein
MLGLVAAHAPAKVTSLMMALVYCTAFISGTGSGFVARFYEPLGPMWFWMLHVAIALGTALGIMLFGGTIRRAMARLERDDGA